MRTSLLFLLPAGLVGGCTFTEYRPYYADDAVEPSISSLSVSGEVGSVGGNTVTIQGQNFGDDAGAVTVVFGGQNATVVSASDSALTVVTPRGPIQGGAVDVAVGTLGGQARLESGYTYMAQSLDPELPTRSDDQIAYIAISNSSLSCLGGLHNQTTTVTACNNSAFTGLTGINARAEGFEYPFPRAHSIYFSQLGGFGQRNAISWKTWELFDPPLSVTTFDVGGDTEDQRVEVGEVVIRNPAIDPVDDAFCSDLTYLADYVYSGGGVIEGEEEPREYPSVAVTVDDPSLLESDFRDECPTGGSPQRAVEFGRRLELCQTEEYDFANTFVYEADWLAGQNFFVSLDEDLGRVTGEPPIDVLIDIPGMNINDFALTLPEYAQFAEANPDGGAYNWVVRQNTFDCPDGDDPGRGTSSDDPVITWEWTPTEVKEQQGVTQVNHYVVVNLTYFSLGWLGGGVPAQATIAVPDTNNFDPETGLSSVSLPANILFAMPDAGTDYGFSTNPISNDLEGEYGDPYALYGLFTMTIERVSEFTIPVQGVNTRFGEQVSGDLVIAYSTGDLAFWENWENPLNSSNQCNDCADSDGDGWVDALDPDCLLGENAEGDDEDDSCVDGDDNDDDGLFDADDPDCQESGTLGGDFTCNDGIDNDGDGLIDADDEDCEDGLGVESSQCINDEDDDGDGWIDEEDPGCTEGLFEDAEDRSAYTCNDGLDNDGDGWIDADDPACTDGLAEENDGFVAEFQCNDGIDNDGHGDIDIEDVRCVIFGPDGEEEDLDGACNDGEDNDADGFIDGNDPDCERGRIENFDSPTWPGWNNEVELECYNAIDDDLDGLTDADDPGCIGRDGLPDGFAPAEAAADPSLCADSLDNDADGWIDEDDPDCAEGDTEVGFGTTQCNDNVDNDADLAIDSVDLGCSSATDDDESDG